MKSISVIGATGLVGRELLHILEERSFPVSAVKLFCSERSRGEKIEFMGDEHVVEELISPEQIDSDIAFFAAGDKISRTFVDQVAHRGVICIDKSSALRMREDVALVVADVNDKGLKEHSSKIIATPNCVATPLAQVLSVINQQSPLESVVLSTYQAVSGAGKAGADELETQVRDLFNLRDSKSPVFGRRIAFNVLPFIPALSLIDEQGKTSEEKKIIEETQKILSLPELKMEVTCVRVPVFNSHSMSVNIATKNEIKLNDMLETLAKTPGIILIDEPTQGKYPTPLDASGEDMTLVGRIRPNTSVKYGLSLWIVSDNLRTGAALNAVRIAEKL
ncbi:MAG: aspartate-semialdehyde dehydrogenase [Myxococcales bacterium]|nr:MAG: aspartate-semialdehyde dehydrogenase [Myxococcales bacterium]